MSKYIYTIPYSKFNLWDAKRYSHIQFESNFEIKPLGKYIKSETDKINLFDFPDEEFDILGISNDEGMYDAYRKCGKEFNQPYKIVKNDYIAYNPYRVNIGSIGIKKEHLKGELISPAYVVFSCKEGLLPDFLFMLMKTTEFNELVKENTSGSVRQNLTFEALSSIEIPIPDIKIQQTIIDEYKALEREFIEAKTKIEKFRQNFRSNIYK